MRPHPKKEHARSARTLSGEARAGREAADHLSASWPDVSWVPIAPSVGWANAAVGRFAELIREQPAIFRASQRGSGRGARSLSPEPFQGLLEALQNADDLGAGELRIAVRESGAGRELLLVHNGARVQLHHVGAMLLPWLSTKTDDPDASGRFGIGQQTLRTLGGPLEIHCAPFHFRVQEDGPEVCSPVPALEGFYSPTLHETLMAVPLIESVDLERLSAFVAGLGSHSLLFLRSVRRLCLVDLETGERVIDHRMERTDCCDITLSVGPHSLAAGRCEMRDPASGHRYIRYLALRPLAEDEPRRSEKSTASSTLLGIAVPLSPSSAGRLYDRLPIPIAPGFPFGINAQFDPDAGRSTLLETEWNKHRLQDVGKMAAAVALDVFAHAPHAAWFAVPLYKDLTLDTKSWISGHIEEAVVAGAQAAVREHLHIVTGDRAVALPGLVYEDSLLDGLLTPEDQEFLRPGLVALQPGMRDTPGRWRQVLGELGASMCIGVEEALELFDLEDEILGPRTPEWFVGMAHAAVKAEILSKFLWKRGVLLADGSRIEPPGESDPCALAGVLSSDSLSLALGVALPIHPAYLADTPDAEHVLQGFRAADTLLDDLDSAEATLKVLARDYELNTIGRVRLEDAQLVALRDAFEQSGEETQRTLGPRIGRNIELRGLAYGADGEVRKIWVSPTEAYLPSTIDKGVDSFPRAAGKTKGLCWLEPGYSRLLKRSGGRREPGAQKFLVRLGAATAPRLVRPENERELYKRDSRPVSPVAGVDRSELQRLELDSLPHRWNLHLLDDRWSPDLDAVLADISRERTAKRRRERGLALLGVLARGWDRTYAGYEQALAVYPSDGYLNDPHPVIATWLARAASAAWLPSAKGTTCAPTELCLPTEASRLAYGNDKGKFLAPVEDQILRSPVLEALRLRRGPSASSLVQRLEQLRDQPVTTEVEAEVRTAYRILSMYCPGDARRPVDDISLRELRDAFSGGRHRGLLLVHGTWYSPKQVFAGEHIFGRRRPFAPRSADLAPLWTALELRAPDASDCVAVLTEVAVGPPTAEDKAAVLQTMRALAGRLKSASAPLRARLRRLPLWTGEGWRRKRPVYAFENHALAAAVPSEVPVWRSGFTSFSELGDLLAALGVTLIRAEDFQPESLNTKGAFAGDHLRPQFARAVAHLRDELARGDQALHDSLLPGIRWDEFAAAPVILHEDLKLVARPAGGEPITVPADAFMSRNPLAFMVRSADYIGSADGGGSAISSLFSGDRQKIAWAWVSMWLRAGDSAAPEQIILSTGAGEDGDAGGTERLIRLQGQVDARGRRGRKGAEPASGARRQGTTSVSVQPLKNLGDYLPDGGRIINPGESRSGVVFPTRDRVGATRDRQGVRVGSAGLGGGSSSPVHRTVPAPVTDREQLALEAVRRVLRLDPPQIADLRYRRGLGADAMDELRQFYEIKMESSGEFPREVTLQGSQLDAAQDDEDFFLAVVAGLGQDSGELRVRFIFNPLDRLAIRLKGEATLTGVRDVEALEYRFLKGEEQ